MTGPVSPGVRTPSAHEWSHFAELKLTNMVQPHDPLSANSAKMLAL